MYQDWHDTLSSTCEKKGEKKDMYLNVDMTPPLHNGICAILGINKTYSSIRTQEEGQR